MMGETKREWRQSSHLYSNQHVTSQSKICKVRSSFLPSATLNILSIQLFNSNRQALWLAWCYPSTSTEYNSTPSNHSPSLRSARLLMSLWGASLTFWIPNRCLPLSSFFLLPLLIRRSFLATYISPGHCIPWYILHYIRIWRPSFFTH